MELETVRITSEVSDENPNGYIVINRDDFVEGVHVLFEEAAADPPDGGPTKKQIIEMLRVAGISFNPNLPKAELLKLLGE